ncbi:MAG: 16S rRNA (uracil(1498)-N(3))-methyltransferase [Candidatus Riflebacteria bacterium]|nr:16S rRNA (uracil(1498)-N(3))-methyltransferase [Candidatus Riflebacteria bacterium]
MIDRMQSPGGGEVVTVSHGRIYEPAPETEGALSVDNRHYLERVLRLRPGDIFTITNGIGREGTAKLETDGRYRLSTMIEPGREPTVTTTLFAALTKGDRYEWLIEKAVELGVTRIVPLITARCVMRAPNEGKLDRWRKIALAAMLQCGGCCLPIVADPVGMRDMSAPDGDTIALLLHEIPGGGLLARISGPGKKLWVASGPEGGFDDSEVAQFENRGWKPVWLGKRLFKADTAPICTLAALLLPQTSVPQTDAK